MISRMRIGNDMNYTPVYVRPDDRFKHVMLIGRTGTGKSQFLLNTWYADSFSPVAKILIDPSGFLAKDAYSLSQGKAHYCSLETPISLNPLVAPYKPSQIVDILSEAINQLIIQTTPNERLTVKMTQILHQHVLFNLERKRLTLDEVRASIAADKGHAETRDGLLARLDMLLMDEDFKQIICGDRSLEINQLIDRQESFILDCSQMGAAKKIFVGTILTSLVKSYFIYSKPREYKPLIFYIDEAHNFLDASFSLVLKEARKYQISVFMATTDFSQMPKTLIHTILSNVGAMICLKAGHVEASMIANEFTTLTASDIQSLEKYWAAVKTPETEAIVKLPRPPFVRPIDIKPMKPKARGFALDWFPLVSYSPRTPMNENERVFADDHEEGSETSPL